MFAQAPQSELLTFLGDLPSEAVAAMFILAIIFTFITVIATTLATIDMFKSIALAKLSKQMVDELLAKGYTPQEIEPLVNGSSGWKKMRKLIAFAKQKSGYEFQDRYGRPVPPVKQRA